MKTNRIKLNIDRDPISSEEINDMMDFGQVLKKAPKGGSNGGAWKPALYIGGAILFAAMVWSVIRFMPQKDNSSQVEQSTPGTTNSQEGLDVKAKTPFVNLPVKEWDIPYSTFEIDAEKGGSFSYLTGSRIDVPPQCLLDDKGNTVSGKVEFRYREFHDALDFALSGIPMTYDSAGMNYVFESGGMCEILAFQNNKPLAMKPGKSLKIDMASGQDGIFNLYQLDTNARNWVHKGNTVPKKTNADNPANTSLVSPPGSEEILTTEQIDDNMPNPELEKIKGEIAEIRKEKPLEPVKANPKRPRFNLDIDEKDYPELSGFKKMMFEVAEEDKSFRAEYYKIVWSDIRLERHQGIKYKMLLKREADKQNKELKAELIVFPVFDEKDYPEAKKTYDQMMEDYNRKLDTRLKKEEEIRQAAEQARLKAEEQWRKQEEQRRKQMQWQKEGEEAQRNASENRFVAESYGEFRRVFAATSFGIWNSDNPVSVKSPSVLTVSFVDEKGKGLPVGIVYQMINSNKLMCNYFHKCCGNRLVYNQKEDNILFSILPDGKVAYNKKEDWETRLNETEIKMTVSTKKFGSAEEVRSFLGL